DLGLLKATLTVGALAFNGQLRIDFNDPNSDGKITMAELTASNLSLTKSGTLTNPISISASVGTGVRISGTDLNSTGVKLLVSFDGTFPDPAGTVDLFSSTPLTISTKVTTTAGGLNTLFDTASNLASFGNAGPNEILGMIRQVADFLAGLANQQVLNTTIPFPSVTIGSALHYSRAFKHDYLDPLFKSGDALKPDANGDGRIDLSDFNFSGIQTLLDRLSDALGLTGSDRLHSDYDPSTHILKFNFSFDRTFGIGTSVASIDAAKAVVSTVRDGSGSGSEIQELIVNATSGHFNISFNNKTTANINVGASPATVQTRINTDLGLGTTVSLTLSGADGFYSIDFG